jgi:phosphoribosylglycinamide formyltransferase-1
MRIVPLGVLISGGGSNLQAIIDQIEAGRLSAAVRVVISNVPDAGGLKRAERHGLARQVVDHRLFPSRQDFEAELVRILNEHGVELVILAGFMRLVGPSLLSAFPNRIMNIHPALLPSFPGVHVWQNEVDHGVKLAGCTVHFVDQGTDSGPIIIQAAVPVLDDDDADGLAARILAQEHRIFSKAIQLYAEDRLEVTGRRVHIRGVDPNAGRGVLIHPPLEA